MSVKELNSVYLIQIAFFRRRKRRAVARSPPDPPREPSRSGAGFCASEWKAASNSETHTPNPLQKQKLFFLFRQFQFKTQKKINDGRRRSRRSRQTSLACSRAVSVHLSFQLSNLKLNEFKLLKTDSFEFEKKLGEVSRILFAFRGPSPPPKLFSF